MNKDDDNDDDLDWISSIPATTGEEEAASVKREPQYPITNNMVCLESKHHPGTIRWRNMIQACAEDMTLYPQWEDDIANGIVQQLAQEEEGGDILLVFRDPHGNVCDSIRDGWWVHATKEEIRTIAKEEFLHKRSLLLLQDAAWSVHLRSPAIITSTAGGERNEVLVRNGDEEKEEAASIDDWVLLQTQGEVAVVSSNGTSETALSESKSLWPLTKTTTFEPKDASESIITPRKDLVVHTTDDIPPMEGKWYDSVQNAYSSDYHDRGCIVPGDHHHHHNNHHHNLGIRWIRAPRAPKPGKPALYFFFFEKLYEIQALLFLGADKTESTAPHIAQLVVEAWKNITPNDRAKWDDMAREDKARYDREKAVYTGPWEVPRLCHAKHANEPKRPVFACLAFIASRWIDVKLNMPHATNRELAQTLTTMWTEAPKATREAFIKRANDKKEAYQAAAMNKEAKEHMQVV